MPLAVLAAPACGSGCTAARATTGTTLFVSNHVSYLDIPVIAGYADGTFVAKAEVARWPLFGQAAKLTRTIFIQRIGAEAKAQGKQIDRAAGCGRQPGAVR